MRPVPGVRRRAAARLALAGAALLATTAGAQPAVVGLPFAVGDSLTFTARTARFGRVGRAVMWVDGPVEVHGVSAWGLHFRFHARVWPVSADDRTDSWVDPRTMAALRFEKHEHNPLAHADEAVELHPDTRQWEGSDGASGTSPTDAPLDELSFMFFVRTLPLAPDSTYQLDRHYDPARNPTVVRVLGRAVVATAAGDFHTVRVEMRVRDPRHYRGEGVIRLDLTDDARHLPVRIESAMPIVGTAVLTLDRCVNAGGVVATQAP